jgi:hypothetical protein
MSDYAWTVDLDRAPWAPSRVGWTGPCEAPADLLDRLAAGEGIRWRARYGDNDIPVEEDTPYEGRFVSNDGDEPDFGPLADLAGPDVGATAIEYLIDGGWVEL